MTITIQFNDKTVTSLDFVGTMVTGGYLRALIKEVAPRVVGKRNTLENQQTLFLAERTLDEITSIRKAYALANDLDEVEKGYSNLNIPMSITVEKLLQHTEKQISSNINGDCDNNSTVTTAYLNHLSDFLEDARVNLQAGLTLANEYGMSINHLDVVQELIQNYE